MFKPPGLGRRHLFLSHFTKGDTFRDALVVPGAIDFVMLKFLDFKAVI